jgi:hypothetical protein
MNNRTFNLKNIRNTWNQNQKTLRAALEKPRDFPAVMELFVRHHAMLHASGLHPDLAWTFDDALWHDLIPDRARCIPPKEEHSIAWLLWHLARCEDIAMNIIVAGGDQVLFKEGWQERLKISAHDTGNAMNTKEIIELSETIDLDALRGYRAAVGRQTRQNVQQLDMDALRKKADPSRLERIHQEGAVIEAAWGIAEYWGRSTVAGLLLMPATRHNMVHINEAFRLKTKA